MKDGKKNLYESTSRIIVAASNQRQIILGLQERELAYLELEDNKLSQIEKKVLDAEVKLYFNFRLLL
jgi:hypothetical protein